MLETWVYGQLRCSFCNRGIRARLSSYRNSNGAEVDFMLEKDGMLFPMEVKRTASPRIGALSGASTFLLAPGVELQPGILFCTVQEILPLGKGGICLPYFHDLV